MHFHACSSRSRSRCCKRPFVSPESLGVATFEQQVRKVETILGSVAETKLSETKTQLIVALWQTGGLYLVYFKISQRAPRVINLYSYHLVVVVVVFYFVFYSYHLVVVVVVLFFTLTIWLLLLLFLFILLSPFGCLPTFESLHLHLLHCAHWDHTCTFSSASAITEAGRSHQ